MVIATQEEVFDAIKGERVYQDNKWGTIAEHPHEVGAYITIMDACLHRAKQAYAGQRGDNGALDEIRQVLAVGVACMEQNGIVYRMSNLNQHGIADLIDKGMHQCSGRIKP
jgi:hypothetical protein